MNDLGATTTGGVTTLKVWAPTASKVRACVYDSGSANATTVKDLTRDAATGVWSGGLGGDMTRQVLHVPRRRLRPRHRAFVRNLVTDPYSVSLTTDSTRSYIADLSSAALKPGRLGTAHPGPGPRTPTDMSIYELHVRDFSISDDLGARGQARQVPRLHAKPRRTA